jgi:iron complex transport system ATP-binding protein
MTAPSSGRRSAEGIRAPSLKFEEVTVRYPGRTAAAVENVSLVAPPGQVTAVVGPNGSGKSTLVRALLRIAPLSGGSIHLDGELVTSLAPRAFATRVAVVPQREEPTVPMLVYDFVALGRHAHRSAFGALRAEDRRSIDKALNRAGVDDATNRRTDQLSGGEWQRVRIARALAQDAPVIVLDEPTPFSTWRTRWRSSSCWMHWRAKGERCCWSVTS